MSNLIHCDGPGCDNTKPQDRMLCEEPWLQLDQGQGGRDLDFHNRQCLANWTTGKPRATTDAEPCMCDGSQVDPHTKAEHQAYPTTTVDGR